MEDFQKIMEIGPVKVNYLTKITDSLLCKIVKVPEKDGYKAFQIFKQCRVNKDEAGEWFVEIDAHDQALPLMFEFKEKYFTYELWNALRLKSINQLRMYEILKQYEKIGERIISVKNLKELLGMNAQDYAQYGNFKIRVLDSCKEALEMYTDIKFTYEPAGKKGSGIKVKDLKFTISRNENYIDRLSLEEFIDVQNVQNGGIDDDIIETVFAYTNERLAFLAGACDNEFSEAEMRIINDILSAMFPYADSVHFADGNKSAYEVDLYNELKLKYDELNLQAGKRKIKSRFGYLKKMLK
jgi:hypothetical protein